MATTSEVKAGLDDIAAVILAQHAPLEQCQAIAQQVSDALGALPTGNADLITTIQEFGTTNAFEANAKAEMAKLASEYAALKAVADAILAIDIG